MTLTPSEMCQQARLLTMRPGADTAGLWPRAAAVLLRQCIEHEMDRLWSFAAPGTEKASTRAQLIALPFALRDNDLAGRASFTWWTLTVACHYRHCQPPAAKEQLDQAGAVARELTAAVNARQASRKGAAPSDRRPRPQREGPRSGSAPSPEG